MLLHERLKEYTNLYHLKKDLLIEPDIYIEKHDLIQHSVNVTLSEIDMLKYLIKFVVNFPDIINLFESVFVDNYGEIIYKDLRIKSFIDECFFNCVIYSVCFEDIQNYFETSHFLLNLSYLQNWVSKYKIISSYYLSKIKDFYDVFEQDNKAQIPDEIKEKLGIKNICQLLSIFYIHFNIN